MKPMRLTKREIKDKETLQQILKECRVLRIGTMDEDGIYIIPMNYGYEWQEGELPRFYVHSAREGRKVRAFCAREEVSFELDREGGIIKGDYACSYSFAFQSIMGGGKIRLVTDGEEKLRGLTCLMEHMEPGKKLNFTKEMTEAVHVYCIEAGWLTGKERRPKNSQEQAGGNP